jgi:hypothetical protein
MLQLHVATRAVPTSWHHASLKGIVMELRRLGAICLVSASVIAMTGGRADASSFTYTFDSDNQGWLGASSGGSIPLAWNGSGGNPGGYVFDSVSGGISGTGNITSNLGLSHAVTLDAATYGATLSFDTALLANSNLTSAQTAFVELYGVLNGNPFSLTYVPQYSLIGGAWTSTSVRLDTSASWVLDTFPANIHTATQADWDAYLPFVSFLVVEDSLAFERSTGGSGTFGFDNITLTEAVAPTAVPEPTSMLLMATGLAGLGLRRTSHLLKSLAR